MQNNEQVSKAVASIFTRRGEITAAYEKLGHVVKNTTKLGKSQMSRSITYKLPEESTTEEREVFRHCQVAEDFFRVFQCSLSSLREGAESVKPKAEKPKAPEVAESPAKAEMKAAIAETVKQIEKKAA